MAFIQGFWALDADGSVANMNLCLLGWGPKADLPAAAAGNKGASAWATDEKILYYSDGSAWAALPLAKIASGTYTGDAAAGRQITTGFAVKQVFIQDSAPDANNGSWISVRSTNAAAAFSFAVQANYVQTQASPYLHATNGFVVNAAGTSQHNGPNVNLRTYYYTAIG